MKPRIFSGIQPSGNLHLGNYLGAIRQWIALQEDYEAMFSVADLHAITVPQDPQALRAKTLEIAKTYLAAGIDPAKSVLFVQSHVREHTELAWILNSTVAKVGDLTKMTQLKDKAGLVDENKLLQSFSEFAEMESSDEVMKALKRMSSSKAAKEAKFAAVQTLLKFLKDRYINPLNITGAGLFDYPVLMAADILLYDTTVVPVGRDQMQHVELTRTLARRFNERFGETFRVPESRVEEGTQLIMGLDDSSKKMSKSAASEYNYIALSDDPGKAKKKIMKAVTDSGSEVIYAEDKPALRNLLHIYAGLTGRKPEEIAGQYVGKGYADFKKDLADVVGDFLSDFQSRLGAISDDEAIQILRTGAAWAGELAAAKMKTVREKVGFLQ